MKTPKVEVGILLSEEIEIILEGKYNSQQSNRSFSEKCKVSARKGNLYINDTLIEYENEEGFIISPEDFNNCACTVNDVVIGIGFHWEQKEVQKFQGDIKFKIIDGKVQLINILPIENYLYSVISSEMRGDSSLSLLKAHAIISRSWLLAQIEKQNELSDNEGNYSLIHETEDEYIRWYDREDHHDFHVCADDHCQRYQGTTRAHNPNVIKAIKETEGEVLMYNDVIADARFSKCCGGVTEIFENCWEPVNHPYLKTFPDLDKNDIDKKFDLTIEENAVEFINGSPKAFCNTTDKKVLGQVLNDYDHSASDFYRWTVEYTQEEISGLIKRRSGIDYGDIIDLIPIKRGESSRLIKLRIVGSKKTLTIGKELEIRRTLSESHLYSSAFTIEKQNEIDGVPQKFVLRGAGWGHGVGLCQIGAAVMGEKGYEYNEILMHYFRGADLIKQY
ncbi:MAG: SpoIID/LytB domain-containing protein [Bacteroidota bacterium]